MLSKLLGAFGSRTTQPKPYWHKRWPIPLFLPSGGRIERSANPEYFNWARPLTSIAEGEVYNFEGQYLPARTNGGADIEDRDDLWRFIKEEIIEGNGGEIISSQRGLLAGDQVWDVIQVHEEPNATNENQPIRYYAVFGFAGIGFLYFSFYYKVTPQPDVLNWARDVLGGGPQEWRTHPGPRRR